jgi:hypothetical protein
MGGAIVSCGLASGALAASFCSVSAFVSSALGSVDFFVLAMSI